MARQQGLALTRKNLVGVEDLFPNLPDLLKCQECGAIPSVSGDFSRCRDKFHAHCGRCLKLKRQLRIRKCTETCSDGFGLSHPWVDRFVSRLTPKSSANELLYAKELLNELTCVICFKLPLFCDLVQCPNFHSICSVCFKKQKYFVRDGLASVNCSVCRASPVLFSFFLTTIFHHLIERFPVPCDNDGCQITILTEGMRDHLRVCPYRTVACPNILRKQCRFAGSLTDSGPRGILHHLQRSGRCAYPVVAEQDLNEIFLIEYPITEIPTPSQALVFQLKVDDSPSLVYLNIYEFDVDYWIVAFTSYATLESLRVNITVFSQLNARENVSACLEINTHGDHASVRALFKDGYYLTLSRHQIEQFSSESLLCKFKIQFTLTDTREGPICSASMSPPPTLTHRVTSEPPTGGINIPRAPSSSL